MLCICVLCAAGGKLVMGGLPAPGVQYAAGGDSDDPDAAETDEAAIQAPDLGQVQSNSYNNCHVCNHSRQRLQSSGYVWG